MNDLTNLIVEYKKTKSKQILNQIFDLLKSIIEKKAQYIYYRKYFHISLYHDNKKIGTFNLFKSRGCEYEDVEQDLNVKIMRIINNFNVKKDFRSYLFASLWNWMPSFVTKNFVDNLNNKNLYPSSAMVGNEMTINIRNNIDKNYIKTKIKIQDLSKKLHRDIEKKVLFNLLNKKGLKQTEIAKKLGITQQRVSQIIIKFKKYLK